MKTGPTFKAAYRARWEPYQPSWDTLVRKDLDASNWDRPWDMPDGAVSDWIRFGLQCAFAGDGNRAAPFFSRAIQHADRLEAEDRFHDTDIAEAGYPGTLGRVVRDRAYARWLLGESLNRAEMRRAAEHMVTWCLTKAVDRRRFIDPMTMDEYLQGVRAALVAADVPFAKELLTIKQKFLWHHGKERELWTRLVEVYPTVERGVRKKVEEFFDVVRDPDFQEVIEGIRTPIFRESLRFDTGIIRQMYVLNKSKDEPVEAQEVARAVAR